VYKKIRGLKQLEKMGFPCPPYQVINITGDKPIDIEKYVLKKVREVGIPDLKGDRIGVTIRVSMPGSLDKVAKHGGLHITTEEKVLKKVLERYQRYKPDGRIIVQHTVDAKCSGALLKEYENAIIVAIPGDAPPLLEGVTTNYEKWVFTLNDKTWVKERAYRLRDEEINILTQKDIKNIEHYVRALTRDNTYLEWSISKRGKLYFYEYYELKDQ